MRNALGTCLVWFLCLDAFRYQQCVGCSILDLEPLICAVFAILELEPLSLHGCFNMSWLEASVCFLQSLIFSTVKYIVLARPNLPIGKLLQPALAETVCGASV